ncbi:MAG: hypothetical protein HY843_03065 [Bdellovibrio sp.]|nr:hypothetical protein [Bdellovibrio sp.]
MTAQIARSFFLTFSGIEYKMETQSGFVEKIFKTLIHLKPVLSVDPISGLPTFSIDVGSELKPESLQAILSLIEMKSKTKKIVVVMHEFQDIGNLKNANEVLAILRGQIQYQKNIPYLFSGSIRKKIDQIFTDAGSPLLKSALPMVVGPIPYEEFSVFILEKFQIEKKTINDELLKKIFTICRNISGDIQQFCEALWSVSAYQETLSHKTFDKALNLIFAREAQSYEIILSELTTFQLKCLDAIARHGGKKVLSQELLKSAGGVAPASMKKALQRMLQRRFLLHDQGEYKFFNPFFRAWLVTNGF